MRLAFIRPLNPSAAVRPPKGDDWLHEPKWDGFRFQIIKDGSQVRFYSRHGAEYTDRLPGMVEAFGKMMPTQSAILDGELVLIDTAQSARLFPLGGFHRSPPQAYWATWRTPSVTQRTTSQRQTARRLSINRST
jgi:hypothetical protein